MQALACHCDYMSESSQHARSGNYIQETLFQGQNILKNVHIQQELEVGMEGPSTLLAMISTIVSCIIMSRYGRSKHVDKTKEVCCILKSIPLTPVKTTYHAQDVSEVFSSFYLVSSFSTSSFQGKERWSF